MKTLSASLLLLEWNRLRTFIHNRYLHMRRGFVSTSAEWGMYVLHALPEHPRRGVLRMGHSTLDILPNLLNENRNDSCAHGGKPISTDRVQKIALFRLGSMEVLKVRLMTCWHEKRHVTSGEVEARRSRPVLTQSLYS